jgi:Zn-dependent peptidase ImmA (M78 family)/transcriptional regulator with XRE-family HTH domain
MTTQQMLASSESFSGERLQIAREFRGWTQKELGERVVASDSLISLCEAGKKKEPALDLVDAFGAVLGFEAKFFYGPIEDVFLEEECSFRRRRATPEKLKTQIRARATLMGMIVRRLRALFKFPQLNVPRIPASGSEEIEAAAEQCRKYWKLGIDGPIVHVGRALEHAGVLIVPHDGESTKIDAFSRNGDTTVIFLNQAVPSTSRWNFDIAHECGHLVVHHQIQTGDEKTEMEADRYASAFLLPRNAFSREFRARPFGWPHIFELKKRWHVSAAAIVKRAYDLGLIGAVQYRRAYKYMSMKGWRTYGEPYEPKFQQPELLDMAMKALGSKVNLTLDSLCSELHFTPETFQELTGVAVPRPRIKQSEVLPFPNTPGKNTLAQG